MAPESATGEGGRVLGDAYVEIGPDDAEYERLAALAVTQEEAEERRRGWQDGDETLRRQFLDLLARRGRGGQGEDDSDPA